MSEEAQDSFRDRVVAMAREEVNNPDRAPDPDSYKPMSDAYSPPVEKEKTFEGNDAVADAAKHLDSQRTAEPEPTPRKYFNVETGAEVPPNETLDLERAAVDLSRARTQEAEEVFDRDVGVIREVVDHVRGVDAQQQPQPEAQQPQATPEQAEQIEFEKALNNPKLRAALEQEVGKLEASRSQYAAAAAQALELSAAACYATFPELNGVNATTLPAVLNVVQQINPQRAEAMRQSLTATERLYRQSEQAQAAQAEIAKARQVVWEKGESDKFEAAIANEPKETVREVEREGLRVLKEAYGITPEGLKQLLNANPGIRAAESQRLLFDAIKTRLAQEKLAAKRHVPVPPVQRPGVSTPLPNSSDEEAGSARKAFLDSPSPRSAAEYLQARRNARG